jgi:hypothetical protein
MQRIAAWDGSEPYFASLGNRGESRSGAAGIRPKRCLISGGMTKGIRIDDAAVTAIRDLIVELRNTLGDKTDKLPSVRMAMSVLASNAAARQGIELL